MNRDEIFQVIRGHLADELEVDPGTISETTRFKEDLEADSLDLYTLVQELEDSYGVRISDEQAARIRTVGQAVEFVCSATGEGAPGPAGGNQEARASAPASAGPDAE
jgi:acyl carrier protein